MERIYLDYAATTYVRDEVFEEMSPYFGMFFGNPSSLYESGREAAGVIERARESIAKSLGAAQKNEIYFTACGTESDNWSLAGVMEANEKKGRHLITTATEHHAVLHTVRHLKARGYDVTVLPVDEYGAVSVKQVREALREDTVLVSVIYANNEVGTINPIREIGGLAKDAGVIFHTDAVQAVGSIPLHVQKDNIDLLSLSAHKFYGPKGMGALYVRTGVQICPLLYGGAQERKKRAGTENVPEIVGMAKALALAVGEMGAESERLSGLRDYMINKMQALLPRAVLNGHPS
ncbi:MAG: aminotransferase class V-fold PLP-dependent enzyme, partial [Christensenella sp.]|uniref:cysteine desulfurase family protein n=1 Tax=Christensenella sp. TaxID=1935934 RepID=UPI002B1E9EA2